MLKFNIGFIFSAYRMPQITTECFHEKPGSSKPLQRDLFWRFKTPGCSFTNSNAITLDQVAAEWCSLAVFMSALLDVPCGQHL